MPAKPPSPIDYGPPRLRTWLNALRAFAIASRPLRTPTCDVRDTPDGSLILPFGTTDDGDGTAASGATPFYVHTQSKTVDDVTTTYFGVEPASDLWVGISWDKQTITGLLTDVTDPDDDGWQTATAGICYLQGTMDVLGTIDPCEIKWGGKLDGETIGSTEILRITIDSTTTPGSPFQSQFTYPIARLTSTTVGTVTTWAVEQLADRHLTLMDLNVNGKVCRYPLAVF